MRRPRDLWTFGYGLAIVAVATWALTLRGHADDAFAWIVLAGGVARMVTGYFWSVKYVVGTETGPGALAATPAGRFRATGWPPSKDPEDYR